MSHYVLLAHDYVREHVEELASNLTETDIAAISLDIDSKRERLLDLTAGPAHQGRPQGPSRQARRRAASCRRLRRKKIVLPKTLPDIEAWFDRAPVPVKAEAFGLVFELDRG